MLQSMWYNKRHGRYIRFKRKELLLMHLFASDLDNTLIHSYKRADPEDVCVEVKDGKMLSFMTPYAYNKLRKLNSNKDIAFVPVTTRSVEQYRRIDFFDGRSPHLALAANGGILLIDGISDLQWFEESKALISDSMKEFKTGMRYLENDTDIYFELRIVDELFVFTKSHDPLKTKECLEKILDPDIVSPYMIGDKVYIFPNILSKGNAVSRLKKKFVFDKTICAGDSEFDVSMLDIADTAYCPDVLCDDVNNQNLIGFDITEKRFADLLLDEFERSCF